MTFDKKYEFLNYIKDSKNFKNVELVGGGWSADLKFKITLNNESKYLLRVSDISLKDKKRVEFETLLMLKKLDIRYSKPIFFGEIPEYKKVYMILSWIDGENVELMMPRLSKEQQYECGLKAGRILRSIHSIQSCGSNEDWKKKNLTKLNERLEIYKKNSNYVVKHLDEMVNFINDNIDLFENRPMSFLHGDYQGRNIVVDQNCNVGAIDFERTSYGDPFEEFNRMMTYTRRWSTDFCNGQIHGYFGDDKIPDEFWKIVAFHCALNLTTTIIFGLHTNQKHICEENELAKEIIYKDFNGFTLFEPSWFWKK